MFKKGTTLCQNRQKSSLMKVSNLPCDETMRLWLIHLHIEEFKKQGSSYFTTGTVSNIHHRFMLSRVNKFTNRHLLITGFLCIVERASWPCSAWNSHVIHPDQFRYFRVYQGPSNGRRASVQPLMPLRVCLRPCNLCPNWYLN